MKSVGERSTRNPCWAILPQLAIIALGIFSVIYAFVTWHVVWDFYLLNVLWIIWASWTMSGICLAAVKRPKWPREGVPEEEKPASFLARAEELIVTVVLAIAVTLFFVAVDPVRMDRFFNDLRGKVLGSVRVEVPVPQIRQASSQLQRPAVDQTASPQKKENPAGH